MIELGELGSDDASSVSDYTHRIKRLLEGNVTPSWIRGEISNLRRQSSGHVYFTLKDESAQLPVVMFRGNASGLTFSPKDGDEVIVYGEISVYEPYGRYQLIARAMVESGSGRLHREFERLKKKLQTEGLFDKDRKKRIPSLPRTIGIATSPTGAAVQDFIRILKRRKWTGRLVVIPVKVQGTGAAAEISAAIQSANDCDWIDLLVIGRGGGSLEDLWCFNEEVVARSIAQADIPIVSAVGHEIDFTLSDFAADARAETPSAAAELITSSFVECIRNLELIEERVSACIEGVLEGARRSLDDLTLRMKSVAPERRLELLGMQIDDIRSRLDFTTRRNLGEIDGRLDRGRYRLAAVRLEERIQRSRDLMDGLKRRLFGGGKNGVTAAVSKINPLMGRLEGISPRATLNRGYVMLLSEKGEVISERDTIPEDEAVRAIFKDGESLLRKA